MDRWCASRYGVSWHKTVFAKTPLTLLNCRHVKSSQKNKEDVFFVFVIGARLPTFTGERSFQLHFDYDISCILLFFQFWCSVLGTPRRRQLKELKSNSRRLPETPSEKRISPVVTFRDERSSHLEKVLWVNVWDSSQDSWNKQEKVELNQWRHFYNVRCGTVL